MFALIDGNNFYVSCERAFQPALRGQPVVVLSNNDGCAISRSDEAKALGIQMAQPYYQFRELERTSGLICLSANFELYGDMSARMMAIAAGLGPLQEIYSIDESFIGDLEGIPELTHRPSAAASGAGPASPPASGWAPPRRWPSCATTSPRMPNANPATSRQSCKGCATGPS